MYEYDLLLQDKIRSFYCSRISHPLPQVIKHHETYFCTVAPITNKKFFGDFVLSVQVICGNKVPYFCQILQESKSGTRQDPF